jgi:hypothetical protein
MKRLVCLIALLFLASGCIYIPKLPVERQSALVGDRPADPIRIGHTRREAIVAKWGEPKYDTPNHRACGYLHYAYTGYYWGILWGPCAPYGVGGADRWDDDDVWLAFDENGILQHCEKRLAKKYCGHSSSAWDAFVRSVQPYCAGGVKP